jgi:hypothetical protein
LDVLREEVGVEGRLEKGKNGIFEVAVNGEVVARKTWMGFPTEEEIVLAVAKALAAPK